MWNPFKKKDPMKATAGVYHLAETFIPQLVKSYNAHFYEENIFEDIKRWKELLKDESKNMDFRFNKIETLGTDFKSNHDVYIVLIKWPEVKMPTAAKACMITINRLNHTAKQYILESSIYGSMIIEMTSNGRMNTGISVPNDQDEFTHFMMAVVNYEGIQWKRPNTTPSNNTQEFILGEKFPMKGYNSIGDHINVALNETSFDVVISLTGLSSLEESAIGDETFDVYVTATNLVPFIIIKFGSVFKADMTINLLKMKQEYQQIWLNSRNDTVRIFLLEGNDARLKCIRTFHFENIDYIKDVCKKQLIYSKSDIDEHIQSLYQRYTIEQLMQGAQVKFTVPECVNI